MTDNDIHKLLSFYYKNYPSITFNNNKIDDKIDKYRYINTKYEINYWEINIEIFNQIFTDEILIHYEKKSIDILKKYKINSNYSYILLNSIILYKHCTLINKLRGNKNKYVIDIEKIATIIISFFQDTYFI